MWSTHFLKLKSSVDSSFRTRKKHLLFHVGWTRTWKAWIPPPIFLSGSAWPFLSKSSRTMCSYCNTEKQKFRGTDYIRTFRHEASNDSTTATYRWKDLVRHNWWTWVLKSFLWLIKFTKYYKIFHCIIAQISHVNLIQLTNFMQEDYLAIHSGRFVKLFQVYVQRKNIEHTLCRFPLGLWKNSKEAWRHSRVKGNQSSQEQPLQNAHM